MDFLDFRKLMGWFLVIVGFSLLGLLIRIEYYFLLGISVMFLVGGIIVILTSGKASISTNKKETIRNIHQSLETVNMRKSEESINDNISHDSEEYRKWKEGK